MIQHLKIGNCTLLCYDKYPLSSHWRVLIGGTNKLLDILEFDGHQLKQQESYPMKKSGLGDISIRDDRKSPTTTQHIHTS